MIRGCDDEVIKIEAGKLRCFDELVEIWELEERNEYRGS
jgi:hypothetical protein